MADATASGFDATAPGPEARGFSFALERHGPGLVLRALHRTGFGAVSADWTGAELRRRIAAGRRQPLARAAGLHKDPHPTVLDATAGLGRDAFTLAALGAQLTLAERQPSIAELLRDAQRRALQHPQLEAAAQRVEVLNLDALELFAGPRRWDVVYLDPMYPDDGKSALPAKEMQILRDLTGGDPDGDRLLTPALACARARVVVKRPLKAPWLAQAEPSMSLASTQLRFDVYLKSAIRAVQPDRDHRCA